MNIKDLKGEYTSPFEIDDKITKLFAFFLHNAPSINSEKSIKICEKKLIKNFDEFKDEFKLGKFKIYSESANLEKILQKLEINDNFLINRKSKILVCKKKNKNEREFECVLRHIRNSIAHCRLYYRHSGNRKYILFEDKNNNNRITAFILLSQSDLKKLKDLILK